MLPKDGQEPKPKYVRAIINKKIMQQFGIDYCVC
jgi:hypothetical protein